MALSSQEYTLRSKESDAKRSCAIAGVNTLSIDNDLMSYLSGEMFDDGDFSSVTNSDVSPVSANDLDDVCSDENVGFVKKDDCFNDNRGKNRSEVIAMQRHVRNNKSNALSRSAINARENRQKKKRYMAGLEEMVKQLSAENRCLKQTDKKQKMSIKKLLAENAYLKNVLANQSTLSALLNSIQSTPGVKFACQLPPVSVASKVINKPADITMSSQGNTHSLVVVPIKNEKQSKPTISTETKKREDTSAQLSSSSSMYAQTPLHLFGEKHVGGMDQQTENETGGDKIVNGIFTSLTGSVVTDQEVIEVYDDSDIEDFGADINTETADAGVCLHVSGQRVSLEFCPLCNQSSGQSKAADHAYSKARE